MPRRGARICTRARDAGTLRTENTVTFTSGSANPHHRLFDSLPLLLVSVTMQDDAAEHAAAFETPTCAHSAATEWVGLRNGGGARGIALRDCARDAPWGLCPAAHEDICVKEYPDVYEPTVRR